MEFKPEKINGVDVEVVYKTVQRLARKHGECHPSMLVEAARPERSPIHGLFDWDVDRAAERYWLAEARRVIRTVKVVVKDREEPVPAFVHVERITEAGVSNGYMPTVKALAGPTRDGVLRDALAQLAGFRRRYESLTELAPVWQALDELEQVAA